MGSAVLARLGIPLASLIQTFAVAEYLNFCHAANAPGISLSSISARVKTLEEYLGIRLFEPMRGPADKGRQAFRRACIFVPSASANAERILN
ncbi:LysR family transcriptional regulator [Paenibacillus sp. P36]|uniref:helix-turn-helix domain-containing protein n=1 Tax=Paenibacillus sp. P36 TaxID=3342538 RepID=UPI0038B3E51B